MLVIKDFFCEEGVLLANKDSCLQIRIFPRKSGFFLQLRFLAYRIRAFLAQTALPVRRASVHGLEVEVGPAGRD